MIKAGTEERPIGDTKSFLEDLKARGFCPRGILDVGANRGFWSEMCSQVYPESRFLLIEPQDEMEESLSNIADSSQGRVIYIKAGAGAEDGELYQTIWADLAGSSFLPEVDSSRIESGEQRKTLIKTIDGILSENAEFIPDLVKLDIQGFELEALKGGESLFGKTEVFIMETSLFEFTPGQVTTIDCMNFMQERGYELYDITEHLRRPYDGALGQVDLAFVKKNGFLRSSVEWLSERPEENSGASTAQNLHACLVHENIDCVRDLVRNLQEFTPQSDILLYDGSGGDLELKTVFQEDPSILIYDSPIPQEWGRTHVYILQCMEFMLNGKWDTMTIVDSDQLLASSGYAVALENLTNSERELKMGLSAPCFDIGQRDDDKEHTPVLTSAINNLCQNTQLCAALEKQGWDGRVAWNFNPSTVYYRDAIESALDFIEANPLVMQEMLEESVAVGEEVYLATIITALGFEAIEHPFKHHVRWNDLWSDSEIREMMNTNSIWVHPIPRNLSDSGRKIIAAYQS